MFKKTLLIIICSLFVFQFKGLLFANEKVKKEESTRAVAEVKTEKKTEEDVIATVNGEKVFRKGLDRRLSVLKRMNQEITRSTQMLVLNQLTKKVLLNQFVEGQNIEVSNEEVQGEVEKIKFFLKSNPNNSEKPL